jgi:hypothetical protein
VVDPRVVNTVSNVSVSVEKLSFAEELVVITSFLQEVKMLAETKQTISKPKQYFIFIIQRQRSLIIRIGDVAQQCLHWC